ncbi:MAG: nitroreductase family protein [Pseudomonadota bacterium]
MSFAADSENTQKLFKARYRHGAPPIDAPLNAVLETLLSHRSVRGFIAQKIADDDLRKIIAAAQSAATSSNLQAWSVVAVRDEAQKARMMVLCGNQKFIGAAPLFLAWCADLSRVRRVAGERSLEGADYLEAFLLAVIDAALAAQNAAIAAESMGLGICYVGALRDDPLGVAEVLKLPPNVFGVFGMAVGVPDPAKPASVRPRLPQEAVLHFEEYKTDAEQQAVETFNASHRDFQQEQNMKTIDWTDRVAARLKDAKALDGRDVLRDVLKKLGFALR